MKNILAILLMLTLTIGFVGCSSDDGGSTPVVETDPWIGTWISAGANVAPVLATYFSIDSVRVTMNEDLTVITEQHVTDQAWSTTTGVYVVTRSATGNVHKVRFNYAAFEQEGIFEITEGNPDTFKLEAVQVIPDYGFVPRTPESGFGSDPTIGTTNIQTYVRIN
ncbi:MAG: hypothetical protein KKA84_11070 [Bacteroidetes bacterium]|nr:hypothetical protein [Bacteroidota bacterium]